MSTPEMTGGVVVGALMGAQFAAVTFGDAPAGSVATFAGPAAGVDGDVDVDTEAGGAASPPPPHAARTAMAAARKERRKMFNLVFMGFPATRHTHNNSMTEIRFLAQSGHRSKPRHASMPMTGPRLTGF
jgi:hypothetical protein